MEEVAFMPLQTFRATILSALLAAAVGLALELGVGWGPGLWVAGTALLVIAVFVGGLAWFRPRRASAARTGRARRGPRR